MNFQTIRFADNNDLPLVLILPSMRRRRGITKAAADDAVQRPSRRSPRDAEDFAVNEFMPAMMRIDRLVR